jgi:hypothetical protein
MSRRPGLRFKAAAVARHGNAESEIGQAHEQVNPDAERLRGGIDDGGLGHRQPVDFHQAAEGLATLVREAMMAGPFSGAVCGFRAKRRTGSS